MHYKCEIGNGVVKVRGRFPYFRPSNQGFTSCVGKYAYPADVFNSRTIKSKIAQLVRHSGILA